MLSRIPPKLFPTFNDTEDGVMSCTGPWCARHRGTHPRRVHDCMSKCVFLYNTPVWSAKVTNGPEPVVFNEASEECGGWTGCVNKPTVWSFP